MAYICRSWAIFWVGNYMPVEMESNILKMLKCTELEQVRKKALFAKLTQYWKGYVPC
jgi:hypothetical protein